MNKSIKIIVGLLLVAVMFLTPVIIADQYMYSRVYFTVPSILTFQVETPEAGSANISDPSFPGNSTNDILFNATGTDSKTVDPCMVGETDCQVRFTTPILKFKNIGSVSFNISIRLNSSLAAALDLWGNVSNATDMDTCADWTLGENDTVLDAGPDTIWNFTKAMCVNNITDVWLFANFTGGAGIYTNWLNYTSSTV